MLGAIIAAVAAIMMTSSLYQFYLAKTYPKSNVYGTWVEQNVASYAAEEFVVSSAGISINGGIVDTQYSWDAPIWSIALEIRYVSLKRSMRNLPSCS